MRVSQTLEERAEPLISHRTARQTKSLFVLWMLAARKRTKQQKIVRCIFKKWHFVSKFDIV